MHLLLVALGHHGGLSLPVGIEKQDAPTLSVAASDCLHSLQVQRRPDSNELPEQPKGLPALRPIECPEAFLYLVPFYWNWDEPNWYTEIYCARVKFNGLRPRLWASQAVGA